jgi:Cu/Ag efflux protein CusF
MKLPRSLFALLALLPAALFAHQETKADTASKNCGCACCKGKETCCCNEEKAAAAPKLDQAKRHPLKGVIVDILSDRSALLVKHEVIPGYMGAMTMVFQVDAPTLQRAVKNQAITVTLVERPDGFWLEDVKPAQ